MNKNLKCLLFFAVVAFSLVVCGNSLIEAQGPTKTKLLIATSGSASAYYGVGAGMANVVNKYVPSLEVSVTTSGGSVDNMKRIGRKEADIAFAMPDIALYAIENKQMFKNQPKIEARGLCSLWSNPLNIIVSKKSKISSIKDLKGKRIATGAKGTGADKTAQLVLETYGIKKDQVKWTYLPPSEQAMAVKDGVVDAIMMTMGPPNAAYTDLSSVHPVQWLSIDANEAKIIAKKSKYYVVGSIEAGIYPGQDQEVRTIVYRVNLVCRSDLKEEQTYNFLKAVFEHLAEVEKFHAVAKRIKLKDAPTGVVIPFHSGAKKFFMERGLISK